MSSDSSSTNPDSSKTDELVETYATLLEDGKIEDAEGFRNEHQDNPEFALLAGTLEALRTGRPFSKPRTFPARLALATTVVLLLSLGTVIIRNHIIVGQEVARVERDNEREVARVERNNSFLQEQLSDAQARLESASTTQEDSVGVELFNVGYSPAIYTVGLTVSGSIEEETDDRPLIEFDHSLESVRKAHKFGVFSDPELKGQKIEEAWAEVPLAENQRAGALHLHYDVTRHYNGWWLKPAVSDWSDYQDGSLVIRLRPGSICTPLFRLEVKTSDPKSSGTVTYPVVVRIAKEHCMAAKRAGFADVSIPLRAFGAPDLRAVSELVVVFQGVRIDPFARKGDLFIRSFRLSHFSDVGSDEIEPLEKPEGADDTDDILEDLGQKAFAWFRGHRHPKTGLVLDRSPNFGVRRQDPRKQDPRMASIASTGYYLSLLPEAVRLDYITLDEARGQARQTLDFVKGNDFPHRHGMLFHFVDWETGERWPDSEVSLLDSAIFFNGAMVVAQFFGEDVAELANSLLDRADWTKFVTTAPATGAKLLALGWTPEVGLLGPMDVRSSEFSMPYFLAVGSRTHRIDPQLWYNTSVQRGVVAGRTILNSQHSLFTSYIGLGWHDLRGLVDRQGVSFDDNAREAALANRAVCRLLGHQYLTYAKDAGAWWGISAGDTAAGYLAFGPIWGDSDGTVFPYAALSALPWIEDELREDLLRWKSSHAWAQINGQYGLAPFNLATASGTWLGQDIIGIDLGGFAASLANQRNETIWKLWMQHPIAESALERLEYRKPEPAPDPLVQDGDNDKRTVPRQVDRETGHPFRA